MRSIKYSLTLALPNDRTKVIPRRPAEEQNTHTCWVMEDTHTHLYKAALHTYTHIHPEHTHTHPYAGPCTHTHTHTHTHLQTHTYTQQTALLMNVDHNSGGLSLTLVLPPCIKEHMPGGKRIDSDSQSIAPWIRPGLKRP